MSSYNIAIVDNPEKTRKSRSTAHAGWARFGNASSRARRRVLRSIELLLRARADFVELRGEPSHFRIQFVETEAQSRDQLICRDAPVIVTGLRFHADTGGGLLWEWIPLQ